jgi:EAL domain-containing protein (putative c-di-GMP-specific phosphodiesterase class I)
MQENSAMDGGVPARAGALEDMLSAASAAQGREHFLQRALAAVRTHLGLQVAYISEFEGNEAVFRVVDAPGLEHLAKPGDRKSLDDIYCRHILAGRLPELIPDTAAEPVAMSLPITAAVPIGAHVSVPLRMPDGEVYGMFCCLGPASDPSLNPRDLAMMRTFAELAAFEIAEEREQRSAREEATARIQAAIHGERGCVYQPIWNLHDGRPIGFEALARFTCEPLRSPDLWFAEAANVGLGPDLELAAIETALIGLPSLPAPHYLALNASPATVADPRLASLLATWPLERLVLEITEHDAIADVDAINAALAPLRARKMRLAVDDAGAGYSGLQQILSLKPDLIKLDRALIQDIHRDPAKRSLAVALASFARGTGSQLIAEGVETEAELEMLRVAGIDNIQGYLLGRPMPLAEAIELAARAARGVAQGPHVMMQGLQQAPARNLCPR